MRNAISLGNAYTNFLKILKIFFQVKNSKQKLQYNKKLRDWNIKNSRITAGLILWVLKIKQKSKNSVLNKFSFKHVSFDISTQHIIICYPLWKSIILLFIVQYSSTC